MYTHAHTHTHSHAVCPSLSLANGDVSYLPADRDIGSVATYTCNPGYRLTSPQTGMTRTCSINGWSSQTFTCGKVYSIGHACMKVILMSCYRSVMTLWSHLFHTSYILL